MEFNEPLYQIADRLGVDVDEGQSDTRISDDCINVIHRMFDLITEMAHTIDTMEYCVDLMKDKEELPERARALIEQASR